MPTLNNSRHERFAQEVAKGQSATAAYRAAGYEATGASVGINAGRLLKKANVRARVDEILAEGAERAGVTVQRIVDELAKVGFANMGRYLHATSGGDPYFVYESLTDDEKAALAEVTVEDFKEGRGDDAREVRRVKFKLHDKLGALEKLGKHLGMFRDKVEHSGPGGGPIQTESRLDLTGLSTDERDALRAILERRIEEPGGGSS